MILKKRINTKKISIKGKSLFLAYDQGLEHGPIDFNDLNVDPNFIIEIAKKGKFNGIVFQKGIAEKYSSEIKRSKIPLILKLNGKTSLVKGDPVSLQLTTVDEAISLGAVAVGYTVYIGSIHESKMLSELEEIQRQAHKKGLPVIAWIYPRGEGTKGKDPKELMAYAARVALEIGVDFVKIQPQGRLKDLKWAKKSAGKVRVLAAGGLKTNEKQLLKQIEDYMQSGFSGLAIGRNVWQSKNPLELTKKIKKIIWK
jgi:fructose-bisphosphate aldolase, class I